MMFYGLFLVIARFVKGSGMDTMIKRKMLYAGMLLLCAVMLVFCMTDRVHAADNTGNIDLGVVKDVKFRNYIVEHFDKDGDGEISYAEADSVTV